MNKKTKKKILIISPIILVLFGVYTYFFNLGLLVTIILNIVLKPTFLIGDVDLSQKGIIKAENVRLYYDFKKIVEAPEVKIVYDIEKLYKKQFKDIINEIKIENPNLFIIRKKSDVNISDSFSSDSPGKSGTGVPIKKISVKDGNLKFRDISYEFPIEVDVPKISGYVTFDKKNGIDLLFSGETVKKEKISYSFTNYTERYSMTIKGNDLNVNTELLQYAYYYDRVKYLDGKIDLDLTIADSGLYGNAKIKKISVDYLDVEGIAENVNGNVLFDKDKIKIDADYDLFNKKNKFTLDYDGTKNAKESLSIKFPLGSLSYDELNTYKDVKDLDFLHGKNKFNDVNVELKLALDKKNEEQFYAIVNFDHPDIEKGVSLKNIKGSLVYTNDTVEIKAEDLKLNIIGVDRNLKTSVKIANRKMDINYSLNRIAGLSNIKGSGVAKFNDEDITLDMNSGILNFSSRYDKKTKKIEIKNKKHSKDKYQIIYDFVKNNLEKIEGNFELQFDDNTVGKFSGSAKNNIGKVDKLEIISNHETIFNLAGNYDLNNKNYDFTFKTNNFPIDFSTEDRTLETYNSVDGQIVGVNNVPTIDVEGTIDEINYGDYSFSGIRGSVRLKNNKLELLGLENSYFYAEGEYDISKDNVNINYEITDLSNEYIETDSIKFVIQKALGKITGNLKNPQVDLSSANGIIKVGDDKEVKIFANACLKDNILKINDIKVNDTSSLSGDIDIEDFSYEISGNIFEENLYKYLDSIQNLRYRVIGKINVSGIKSQINIKTNFSVDEIFYRGFAMLKILGEVNYNAEELSDGIIDIAYLNLVKNDYKIASIKGFADLKDEFVDIETDGQEIDIQKTLGNEQVKGNINLKAGLKGNFDDLSYFMSANSGNVEIKDKNYGDFNFDVSGDKYDLKLDNFKFKYLDNSFHAKGIYVYDTSDYNFEIKSDNIQLDFLNPLLNSENIDGIKGEAWFNLGLNNHGNYGTFIGKNIDFNLVKLGVDIKNLNSEFILNKSKFEIKEFNADANGGKINLTGDLDFPTISEIKNDPYFYNKLNYDFNLVLKEFNYDQPGYMDFIVNTNLKANANKIIGGITIKSGKIVKIPGLGSGFNLFKIIKRFLLNEKEEQKEAKIKTSEIKSNIGIDVSVNIEKPIIMDIPDVLGIIADVQGEFGGRGKFTGDGNKINFMGDFQIANGKFQLNESEFKVTRAAIIFNNPNEYYPNLNPMLLFDSTSRSMNNYTDVSIYGAIKSLNFKIQSNQDISTGTVASLFSKGENGDNQSASSFILQNVVGSQLSNTILGPISRGVKSVFGLSKLKISSDFKSSSYNGDMGQTKNNNLNIGAKIQAEDSIYKNKLFWIAEAKFMNAFNAPNSNSTTVSDSITDTKSKSGGGSFNQYRGAFEYRIGDKSFGLGAENLQANDGVTTGINEKNNNSINYYIDFRVQKKYDSISEMFKKLF